MTPDEINTNTTDAAPDQTPKSRRKLPWFLGAAAIALIIIPAGMAAADMRDREGGYKHGHGDYHGHMRGAGRDGHMRGMGGMRGERMFEYMDTDDDGKVTQAEVEAMHAARFASIDADGNGEISLAEVAALEDTAREARRNMRAARRIGSAAGFVKADTDSNGTISAEEFASLRMPMFERLDTDDDGAISREEMEEMREQMMQRRGGRDGRGQRHGHRN